MHGACDLTVLFFRSSNCIAGDPSPSISITKGRKIHLAACTAVSWWTSFSTLPLKASILYRWYSWLTQKKIIQIVTHIYIKIGWLTMWNDKHHQDNPNWNHNAAFFASTNFLKEGMRDNITHCFMMMNPHWTLAKTKEMIIKLLHKAFVRTNTEL